MKNRKLHIISLFIFFIMISGCEDRYISSIPNYPVSMQLNLTTGYPTFKDNVYQVLTFTQPRHDHIDYIGYGGVLVICGLSSTNAEPFQYYAFDMACPYEADQNIRVIPNESGQAICESCGSVYDIGMGYGTPSKDSPSKEFLKSYKCRLSKVNYADILTITAK